MLLLELYEKKKDNYMITVYILTLSVQSEQKSWKKVQKFWV